MGKGSSGRKKLPTRLRVALYLRLYVTGDSASSLQAIANAKAICSRYFAGAHVLEILDLLERPGQALMDGIVDAPTLIRIFPAPVRRINGNLSKTAEVLAALGGR